MIIHVRIKKNSPKTYIERITKEKYIAYISRSTDEEDINEIVIKLVSKEFFTPPQKIFIKTPASEDKMVEIL